MLSVATSKEETKEGNKALILVFKMELVLVFVALATVNAEPVQRNITVSPPVNLKEFMTA